MCKFNIADDLLTYRTISTLNDADIQRWNECTTKAVAIMADNLCNEKGDNEPAEESAEIQKDDKPQKSFPWGVVLFYWVSILIIRGTMVDTIDYFDFAGHAIIFMFIFGCLLYDTYVERQKMPKSLALLKALLLTILFFAPGLFLVL